MKKSILLFAVGLGILTSCDPIKDEDSLGVDHITADALLSGATFAQYSDAECTTEAEDGNFIKFNCPNVSALTIYYLKADSSESVLSSGKAGGVFQFVPKRGSDPTQTLYFRYINQNGEEVVASKDFTVQVAGDLAPELKLLVSDDGTKTWKWNTNAPDGRVWGNMGSNSYYSGADYAMNGGTWWGVTSEEEFLTQGDHCSDGFIGDQSMDATMVFTEDGDIYCYDASGKQIRSGKFNITEWNPEAESGRIGVLNTDAGSILWPYEINSGGRKPTWFEIAYLTPGRLILMYPDNGAWDTGGWSEGTFWQFYSDTDVKGCLTDNAEATWEWDDTSGQCWGNAGYGGFVYGGAASLNGGQWWGVTSDGMDEQIANYGYGLADGQGATMTFTSDGLITKSSGGKGSYTYDVENRGDIGGYNEGKTWGRLATTGDGILFPIRINSTAETEQPSEYDIVYFDDSRLVLAYPNYPAGGDNASWQECTFWRFKKQEK